MSDIDKKDAELASRGYPDMMGTGDAQRALGVSKRTVHDLVSDGMLEAIRIRAKLRFERRDIAHFLCVSKVRR